jgi:hypothetical protein
LQPSSSQALSLNPPQVTQTHLFLSTQLLIALLASEVDTTGASLLVVQPTILLPKLFVRRRTEILSSKSITTIQVVLLVAMFALALKRTRWSQSLVVADLILFRTSMMTAAPTSLTFLRMLASKSEDQSLTSQSIALAFIAPSPHAVSPRSTGESMMNSLLKISISPMPAWTALLLPMSSTDGSLTHRPTTEAALLPTRARSTRM